MTKRFTRHALVTAISALATASIALHAQAATDISLGHTLSSTSHYSVGAEAFKETLERLSDGAFTVTEHASGSLGGEREMIEGLQIGTVDVVITSSGPLGNFVPETYVLDLPFLFENYDQARCVLDSEIGDELLAKMSDHGLSVWRGQKTVSVTSLTVSVKLLAQRMRKGYGSAPWRTQYTKKRSAKWAYDQHRWRSRSYSPRFNKARSMARKTRLRSL